MLRKNEIWRGMKQNGATLCNKDEHDSNERLLAKPELPFSCGVMECLFDDSTPSQYRSFYCRGGNGILRWL